MKDKSKVTAEIRALARGQGRDAVKALAAIMNHPDCSATARVSAAQTLLDRGWGKVAQTPAGEDGAAPMVRIRRVIVFPRQHEQDDKNQDAAAAPAKTTH